MASKRGQKRAGPWMCGLARQRSLGIVYGPHDIKFERALAKFRERYPDWNMPTDMQLCQLFDELAEALFGSLKVLRDSYRDRVERARKNALASRKAVLLAELRSLDKAADFPSHNESPKEFHHGKN